MRQDKTVARILLIFSIANVVLAAPASVRQRRLVTDGSDDEPMDQPGQAPGPLAGSLPAESEQDGKLASSDGPLYQHLENYFDLPSAAGSEHDGKLASSDGPLYQHLESYFDLPPASGSLYASAAGSEQNWRPASLDGTAHQGWVSQPNSPPRLPSGWPSDYDSALAPDSLSGLHQYSVPVSGAPPSHDDLSQAFGGLRLKDGPVPSLPHTDWRPTSNWEMGESSSAHTGSGAPESSVLKSGVQPWDEDMLGWHNLNPAMDIDQASTGGKSQESAWSEVEADVADEVAHLHRSFERSPERDHGHHFSWGVRFCSLPSFSCRHLNQIIDVLTYDLPQ